MLIYGIKNVRGGSYINEVLFDYQEKSLLNELFIQMENNHQETIEELIRKYADNPISKKEAIDKIKTLETIYAKYQTEVKLLDKIKIDVLKMRENLEWLENICKSQADAFANNKQNTFLYKTQIKEYIEKYREILKNMKKIYNIFTIELDMQNTDTKSPLCKYPQFVFDDFFYHGYRTHLTLYMKNNSCSLHQLSFNTPDTQAEMNGPERLLCESSMQNSVSALKRNRGNSIDGVNNDEKNTGFISKDLTKSIQNVTTICNNYRSFLVNIENRIDEREFDMNSLGKDIEWKIPREIYLLNLIIFQPSIYKS